MSALYALTSQPLSRKLMILYGLPHLTHTIVVLPMALFIPSFYADELGLPLARVGLAISISRFLDIIIDPIVGVMSDQVRTRWGRRKPWLAFGTPLLILCAWMIFVPGKDVSVSYLFIWATLLYMAYTFVDLPYKAWGAELSTDYSERSRVTAWREAFGFFGQMLFLAILILMSLNGVRDIHLQLLAIAILIVVSQPILVAATLWKVAEREPEVLASAANPDKEGPKAHDNKVFFQKSRDALTLMVQNHAFMRTLAAIVFLATAVLMQATLHRFVLNHVVKAPDVFAPMIMVENFVSIVCLPFWIWISDSFGKHRAICFCALWIGFWSLFFPLVGEGDTVLYVSLILLRGSSLAAIFFLASSIGADVVDFDTVVSGRQRTGLFFSVWGIASKLAVGLGVLLGTSLPAAFGFDPSQTVHSAASIDALLAIYGWLPCAIMLFGIPFLWNFPIDKNRQQELRNRIASAVVSEDLTDIAK
jgi:glycoside/pentoside/hexuronide:cation symporter, GPH family